MHLKAVQRLKNGRSLSQNLIALLDQAKGPASLNLLYCTVAHKIPVPCYSLHLALATLTADLPPQKIRVALLYEHHSLQWRWGA